MGVLRRVSGWLVSVVALAAFLVCLGLVVGSVARDAWAGMTLTAATPIHTHSDDNTGGGSLNLSGSLSSTRACASGYLRITPNYCANSGAVYVTYNAATASCQELAPTSAWPASTKRVVFRGSWVLNAANSIGTRTNGWTVYNDGNGAMCDGLASGVLMQSSVSLREFAATAAGTRLAEGNFWWDLCLNCEDVGAGPDSVAGKVYIDQLASANGVPYIATIYVVGYYD